MKRILSLFLLLFAGLIVLNGCEVDHTLDAKKYGRVYIPQARDNPVEYAVITGVDSTQVIEYEVVYSGPGKPKHDITVHLSIDPSLVDSFNAKKFTFYPMLPKDNYELSSNTTTIPAGQTYSETLKLKIKGNVSIPDSQYLLPLTISETNGKFQLNENLKTAYFLISTHRIAPLNTDVIITGFLVNAPGSDVPQKGDVKGDGDASFTCEGGHEYIQLMALRDIDFSETPYSVVVGRHYHEHKQGWASGEDMSFKFNLTEGQAQAGTFFYVGEGGKVINGYNDDGLSTDISDANWIRSIQVNLGDDNLVAGDGFGNSTSGLLTNSGEATGIAVFEGTNITAASVPVDAVFYGDEVGGALVGEFGYRIPTKSDLYSAVNEEGDPQPLFGQGSNLFMVDDSWSTGQFVQMGGVFSKKYIFKGRNNPTILELEHNSQLSDIEGGAATQFIE